MSNRRQATFSAFFIVLMLLGLATVTRADITGSVQGVVRDRSQGVVVGAQITIMNVETNLKYQATSGVDGSYRILALPPGNFRLTATAMGFRTFVESDIVVKVNDQLQVDVTLDVGSAQQEVINVEANAVHVQTESTQLGDTIDSKKMLALPLNGRSYISLLGLQAGVAPDTAGTIGGDRPVSGILSAGNISVNGQRETANAFLVNGGDVSEGRNLGVGLVANLDSVEEFRLQRADHSGKTSSSGSRIIRAPGRCKARRPDWLPCRRQPSVKAALTPRCWLRTGTTAAVPPRRTA